MPATKVDIAAVPASAGPTHRYVTIPETDLFDAPHPAIRINDRMFGPGTHYVESTLADTVEERLRVYTRSNVRILQPKRDTEAERIVARGRGSESLGASGTNF